MKIFVLLPLLLHLVRGNPLSRRYDNYVVHEKRVTHEDWKPTRRLEGHVLVPLRFGLKQTNLDLLRDHLLSVSDPISPNYGNHWTPERIVETFSPSQETHDAVREWLISSGINADRLRVTQNRGWVEVQAATVDEVEQLLNTEYHVFEHANGEQHAACSGYSLPENIAKHVDFVTPTIQPNIRLARPNSPTKRSAPARRSNELSRDIDTSSANPLSGCDTAVVPACLQAVYNMTYTPKATDKNSMGIVSYYPNIYLQSDLDAFFRNFSPSLVGKSPTLVSIDGGSLAMDTITDSGEDDWILEYVMTFVQPQNVTLMQLGNNLTGHFFSFNEWLDAVDGSYCTSNGGDDFTFDPQLPNPLPGGFNDHSCGTLRPPNVVSNSQSDLEYRLTPFYTQRQCNEFAKLGLMGVTILYSAGNFGAAGAITGYCIDENNATNLNATRFNPAWPASCPWITAVGGTQIKANASLGHSPEEVWNEDMTMGFFESGGGGFSNRFPTADYQKNLVDAYLTKLRKTNPSLIKNFNPNGRAYPDISANAHKFFNIENGGISVDSGTSGATPTIASIITLVNDARLSAGKKPVGFINPAIYSPSFTNAFNDIVDGTSQGCKGLQGNRAGGFQATPGWDPASGVGTPNLGLLIEKWLALP